MSDETNYGTQPPGDTGAPAGTAGTAERVGFCQDCGTPLTRETVRAVGTGVFCEPCLAARVGTKAGAQQGYTTVPPVGAVPPVGTVPVGTAEPHPVLAGFLGLIPGVGAMYNGQYAKAVAHLVVFVVLTSLSKHVDALGLLVVGWVFYQVFDAYHTAKARLEGRPLPNPFGLNDIGERMGFGRQPGAAAPGAGAGTPPPTSATWTGDPVHTGSAGYAAGYGTAGYTAPGYAAPGSVPPSYAPPTAGPEWVGYVPPVHFGQAPPVPPTWQQNPQQYAETLKENITAQAVRDAGATSIPYTQTYAGDPGAYAAVPAAKRFPVGAFWLIGLGVVFLLFEFGQQWGWSLNFNWVLALLFAGLAALTLVRRMHTSVPVVCILRGPVLLAVLAVMFLLQALDVASLARTWPILFIAFGAILMLERSSLAHACVEPPVYPANDPVAAPMQEAEAERTRAAWAAANPVAETTDLTKGGQ